MSIIIQGKRAVKKITLYNVHKSLPMILDGSEKRKQLQ